MTSVHSTFSGWMVNIFVQDSLCSNHSTSSKLDKLGGHLTGRKANINCSKGHSVQLSCTVLNCHQIWTAISSITHPARITVNVWSHPLTLWGTKSSQKTHISVRLWYKRPQNKKPEGNKGSHPPVWSKRWWNRN